MKIVTLLFLSLLHLPAFSETPTVASIIGRNGESCLASFIDNETIITANHCMLSTYDKSYKIVRPIDSGESDEIDEASLKGDHYRSNLEVTISRNKGIVETELGSFSFISVGRIAYDAGLDYSINKIKWESQSPEIFCVNFNSTTRIEKNQVVYSMIPFLDTPLLTGKFFGLATVEEEADPRKRFRHTIETTHGFSGAPIFDEHNNLLSIVSGGMTSQEYDYGPDANKIYLNYQEQISE